MLYVLVITQSIISHVYPSTFWYRHIIVIKNKIQSIADNKPELVSHPIYYFIAHINCVGLTKSKRSGYLFGMR